MTDVPGAFNDFSSMEGAGAREAYAPCQSVGRLASCRASTLQIPLFFECYGLITLLFYVFNND